MPQQSANAEELAAVLKILNSIQVKPDTVSTYMYNMSDNDVYRDVTSNTGELSLDLSAFDLPRGPAGTSLLMHAKASMLIVLASNIYNASFQNNVVNITALQNIVESLAAKLKECTDDASLDFNGMMNDAKKNANANARKQFQTISQVQVQVPKNAAKPPAVAAAAAAPVAQTKKAGLSLRRLLGMGEKPK